MLVFLPQLPDRNYLSILNNKGPAFFLTIILLLIWAKISPPALN